MFQTHIFQNQTFYSHHPRSGKPWAQPELSDSAQPCHLSSKWNHQHCCQILPNRSREQRKIGIFDVRRFPCDLWIPRAGMFWSAPCWSYNTALQVGWESHKSAFVSHAAKYLPISGLLGIPLSTQWERFVTALKKTGIFQKLRILHLQKNIVL